MNAPIPALFLAVLLIFSTALHAATVIYEPENFVLIRGDEFIMGSPVSQVGRAEVEAFLQKNGITTARLSITFG